MNLIDQMRRLERTVIELQTIDCLQDGDIEAINSLLSEALLTLERIRWRVVLIRMIRKVKGDENTVSA